MRSTRFARQVVLPSPAAAAFEWHARPGAFDRLLPPWVRLGGIERSGGIEDGSRVTLRVPCGPFKLRWVLEHRDCRAGKSFRDVQVAGPFLLWDHLHNFEDRPDGTSRLEDRIDFDVPGGVIGRLLAFPHIRRSLERLFTYRHAITRDDLAHFGSAQPGRAMKILVSGSSGFVGSSLVPFLRVGGHEVIRLLRPGAPPGDGSMRWSPDEGVRDRDALEGLDAVVHLAGANIAAGRWTPGRKELIRRSRVDPTMRLSEALAGLQRPPRVLAVASAIGVYGDRGDELLDEESRPGEGFLADVARDWEEATAPAARAGIRVVHLRFGMVLGPTGGALARMLTPFRLALGGRIGSGRQFMSWISIEDAVGAIHHALADEMLAGPVNVVAPAAVTNAEFTRTLGRVLSRPALLPMPAAAARLAFGEMADALLLASTRVGPARLRASGYTFRHPELEAALRHLLGRVRNGVVRA